MLNSPTSAASGQESTQRPDLRAGEAAGLPVGADSDVRRAAKVLNRFHLVALEEIRLVGAGGVSGEAADSFDATLRALSND